MTWTGTAARREAAQRTAPHMAPATATGGADARVIDPARPAASSPCTAPAGVPGMRKGCMQPTGLPGRSRP